MTLKVLVVTSHRSRKITEPLESASCDLTVVSDSSPNLVYRGARSIYASLIATRGENYDVVIGDHAGVTSLAAAIVARIHSTPFVLRLGGNIWEINRGKVREHYYQRNIYPFVTTAIMSLILSVTVWLTDGYLAVSETVARAISDNTRTERSKIGIIGVPVELEKFRDASGESFRKRFDLESKTLLVTVTNLRFRQKYEALTDALPSIGSMLERNPGLHYLIAGDGMYRESLVSDIDEQFSPAVSERVHTPGHIEKIEEVYAAGDAMVYFSYLDGWPNVIAEAMATGCPVLANDSQGLAEQIDDGETGILVESPTDECLEQCIEDVLCDNEVRTGITENARDRVESFADPETVGVGIIESLETVLTEIDHTK